MAMSMIFQCFIVFLYYFVKDTAAADVGVELTTLLPPQSTKNAFFGGCVSISNNVVIGSTYLDWGDGSVSIYQKGHTDFDAWPGTTIYPPANTSVIGFGVSVAVIESENDDGTDSGVYYAAIGAIHDYSNENNIATGAVYIYIRKGSWWELSQRLAPSDLLADDQFGSSLSMHGDRLVVGANYGDSKKGVDTGRAFVYVRDSDGMYQPEQELKRGDAIQNANDYYGYSVSIYDDVALVGAYGTDLNNQENSGSVYVFARNTDTGKWVQESTLVSGDTVAADYFGHSVSVSGNYALVGAFGADSDERGMQSGAAYLFVRNSKKQTWDFRQKLYSDDAQTEDQFAASVFLANQGSTAIISARGDDTNGNNAGTVYLFNSHTHQVKLKQQGKLFPNDAADEDWFGYSLAMDEYGSAVIGAPLKNDNSGQAYIFKVPIGNIANKKSRSNDTTGMVVGLVIVSLFVVFMITFIVLRSRGMLPDNLELAIMRMESNCSNVFRSIIPQKEDDDFFAHTRTNDNNKGNSAEPYSQLDSKSSALV